MAVLGAALGIALWGVVAAQRRLIYPAPLRFGTIAAEGFADIELTTDDGLRLRALYRPAEPGQRTIIFFHGNGDSLRGSLAATRTLAEEGYGLLLPEYRGYGGNPGRPDEAGLYADGRAAIEHLRGQGIGLSNIAVIGNSLGSGVATEMARAFGIGGLAIISGFTSLHDVISTKLPGIPVATLVYDRFANAAKLPDIASPVLVLHGSADRVIPVAQGRSLAAAAVRGEYLEFARRGHNLVYLPAAQDALLVWLARLAPPEQSPA